MAANISGVINVNRNLGFFTGGYYWLIGLIPALFVAPSFMNGEVEFGVVTQSATAFSTLVGAFSVIVTQLQSISSFTAVVSRLESLIDAVELQQPDTDDVIRIREDNEQVAYEGLTLPSPESGRFLLRELSMSVKFGTRVLITGANETAYKAMFKATAGLSIAGEGRISRPNADGMFFLARQPYVLHGTLRELLVPGLREGGITDEHLMSLLREFHLEQVLSRAGGIDEEQDWNNVLSQAERHLLAVIHIILSRPRFVFLDRPGTVLRPDQVEKVLTMLTSHSISYITSSKERAVPDPNFYDALLEIQEDGGWTLMAIKTPG
jgi:putative ATP-binding cassette transporter